MNGRSNWPWIVGLLCSFGFCACVTYKARPLRPRETAAAFAARSLDEPGLREFIHQSLPRRAQPWPPARWDLDLLTLAAIYFQPELDIARTTWLLAQAGEETAASVPNPSLSLTPGVSFNPAKGTLPWMPAIGVEVPIETASKRDYRMAQARQKARARRLDLAGAAWRVRARVQGCLVELAADRRRAERIERQVEIQRQMVTLFEQRIEAGAIAPVEASRVRLALTHLLLDADAARRKAELGRACLAEAIGLPVSAVSGIDLADRAPPAPDAKLIDAAARDRALTGRADLLAALAEYAISELGLQIEIARQIPDIHLGTGYQFDQGEHKWTLGLTIELPIFNTNSGPIHQAVLARRQAAARFEALQAQVIAKLERALLAFRAAQSRRTMVSGLLADVRARRDRIAAQFAAGAVDRLELLTAEAEVASSEVALADQEAAAMRAEADVEAALQQPFAGLAGLAQGRKEQSREAKP